MTIKELKFRAVVHLKKRQDVNQVAEKLYRWAFASTEKIIIREAFREDDKIIYCVSDRDEIEPLFLIKSI